MNLLVPAVVLLASLTCAPCALAQDAAAKGQPSAQPASPQPPATAQPQAGPAADQPSEAAPDPAKQKTELTAQGEGSAWETVGEAAFFVGIAAALGGGALVLMTRKSKSDFENETDPAKKNEAKELNDLYQTLSIAAFVTGGVLLAAGGTMWALLGDQEEKKTFVLTPIFDGRIAGVGMSGRF